MNKCIAINAVAVTFDAPARSEVKYSYNGEAGYDMHVVVGYFIEERIIFLNDEYRELMTVFINKVNQLTPWTF